jgi:hypothetical protein
MSAARPLRSITPHHQTKGSDFSQTEPLVRFRYQQKIQLPYDVLCVCQIDSE